MRKSLTVVITCALMGCELTTVEAETGSSNQELLGKPTLNPNSLTFGHWADNPAVIGPALECALSRIRAATCLPVDVSLDAWHWVRQRPQSYMPGLTGRTTGQSWDELRINVLDTLPTGPACRALLHEIAEHALRRKNDHAVSSSNSRLNAVLVESICQVQDCPCQNPEL